MDALNLERNEPMPITDQQLKDVTKIAFDLEQGSHFEDSRGAGKGKRKTNSIWLIDC